MPEDITLDEWQAEMERELEAEAQNYKPRNRPWTRQEVAVLCQFYGSVKTLVLAKKLDRTINAIHMKATDLGLKFDG
jgi:hypothetical protein